MENNLTKIGWREAATGGLYLGLAWVAAIAIEYIAESGTGTGWLKFAALIFFIYFYTKRLSSHYKNGFSFGQSFGFIIKMMLFSGVVAGLGQYVFQNFVNPGYFQSIMDTMEETLVGTGFYSDDQAEEMIRTMSAAYKNPLVMVMGGILNMVLGGGLIGLVMSAFLRKAADPFAEDETPEAPASENDR